MTIEKCRTCNHAFTTGKDRWYCKKALADKDDCEKYEMTREEKVKKIKEKINEEANKKINESKQLLEYLFSKSDDEFIDNMIDICINNIYLYKSILHWINKDTFCNEVYQLNNYVVKDKYLNIMLLDSFNFCFNYIMSLFEVADYNIDQEILIYIGASFNDNYIINKVITVMDEIFYNKDLKEE